MNLKKVSDGLHKLNTSQIIALGFAGVIFVGGLILWMPFCSAPGQAVTFPDAVYSGDQRMCDRTFHSCYGSPVEPHWKSGYPVPDTDRRDRTGRTGEYDIHQPPAENFPEKPTDHQGIL